MITKGPPLWRHQLAALRFAHKRRGTLWWIPMRAGKTRTAIDYCQNTGWGETLVVCPHKVIPVWQDQIERYAVDPPPVTALNCQTLQDRADIIKQSKGFGYGVILINYEALDSPVVQAAMLAVPWKTIILDEVHRLQAPAGIRSRFTAKLCKTCPKVIGLSGTPGKPLGNPKNQKLRDQGILDLYGVMRTIAPGHFAWTNQKYKEAYGVWNPYTPFPQLTGYQNTDDFDAKLAQVCFHVREEDLQYSMPPTIIQPRPITLPPDALAAYRELEKTMVTSWNGDTTSAPNVLVKQLRLQQMAGGFLQPNDGEIKPIHTAKIDALLELIEDLPEQERIIVFCQFKPEMAAATAAIKAMKRHVYHIKGGTDTSAQWKATPGAGLVVQTQAGGEGLDLSAANFCVYLSLCHSLKDYQQSFKRPQIPNKKTPVAYYPLLAQGTIDEDIWAAQAAGAEVIDAVSNRLQRIKENN